MSGPITIFDKSLLQSLSMDEAVWLDTFFLVNVVPLFYVETLADLEKKVAQGSSPEKLVGMLAAKTPPNAVPNVHHRTMISAELTGWNVPMTGQVVLPRGDVMRGPQGEIGVHVDEFAEAVALHRWRNHEFLQIEREVAKWWRVELADRERDRTIAVLRNILPAGARIPDLAALKAEIDVFCDSREKEAVALALDVLGVPEHSAPQVLARWEAAGRPGLAAFAPYTTHVLSVDLVYYLGIYRGFISGERASNRIDMAYLYYLPFAMLFTSKDNLHRRTAPLFLRPDQSFVEGDDFKAALKEIDEYFDGYPDEVKALGVMAFARCPPPELEKNCVVRLWDKHLQPSWREQAESPEQVLRRWQARPQQAEDNVDRFRARIDGAQPVPEAEAQLIDGEPEYMVIRRQVPVRLGKWRLVPKEAETTVEDGST